MTVVESLVAGGEHEHVDALANGFPSDVLEIYSGPGFSRQLSVDKQDAARSAITAATVNGILPALGFCGPLTR
jgi:hypothetical protein